MHVPDDAHTPGRRFATTYNSESPAAPNRRPLECVLLPLMAAAHSVTYHACNILPEKCCWSVGLTLTGLQNVPIVLSNFIGGGWPYEPNDLPVPVGVEVKTGVEHTR